MKNAMKHPAWNQYLLLPPPLAHTMLASKTDIKWAQLSGVNSIIIRERGGGDKELIELFISISPDFSSSNIKLILLFSWHYLDII